MTTSLDREALRTQIDRFVQGTLSENALARWAFDQFYAAEEGRLAYEPGYGTVIDEVLEELMWGDSPPFTLNVEAARRLQQRLAEAEPEVAEEE